MKGVIISPIEPAGKDTRGPTFEWVKGRNTRQITFCERATGTVSGNHYHRGDDASKNPERVIILSGRVRLIACNGAECIDELVDPWSEITIAPLIAHSYIPADPAIFAEQRSTLFHSTRADTYPITEYGNELRSRVLPFDSESLDQFLALQSRYKV